MVEHTLWTEHESLVQGYYAIADCATVDCARLHDKRYYCTTEKKKNTTVRTVPRGVRGSGVPVRSSADTVEGFGEVIDQRPETPSVPSICGGPSGRRSEVQARGE